MHIHADHCNDDMTLQDYSRKVWDGANHNFVTIDLTSGNLKTWIASTYR